MDPQSMDDVLCVEIPVSDGIEEDFNPEEAEAFARWLEILNAIEISFVVSGALAIYAYTGIWRNTKDLDVFLKPSGLKPALDAISAAGYETEIRDRRWLAKVFHRSYFMDLIFGSGMGISRRWLLFRAVETPKRRSLSFSRAGSS